MELDRRAGGVRVIDTPYSRPGAPRRRAPHWERSAVGGGSRSGHLYVPTPVPIDPNPSPGSAVFVAKTEPNWIEEPENAAVSQPELPAEPPVRLASFFRRALAWGIDASATTALSVFAVLVGLTFYGWTKVLPSLDRGFDEVLDGLIIGRQLWAFALGMSVLFSFVYTTLTHGLLGTTLGQHLLHLRLETKDGESPRLSDAAWRAGISLLSLALGGLGVAWAIFDPQGLSLHDRIVGTRVVRTDPPPPPEEPEAVVEETPVAESEALEVAVEEQPSDEPA